jgi:TolA-binding protein
VVEIRCSRHGARAAWRCRGCGEALCPGCAFLQRTGTADLVACVRCRGLAEPITVHRREVRSFAARLPGAMIYPLLPGPLVGVLAAGSVVALCSYFALVGPVLGFAVQWTFLFSIVRQGARGAKTFEPAELAGEGFDLFLPALRGFVGTAIVWLPAVSWFWFRFAATRDVAACLADPVLWLILLAGLAYAPAAIMHAAAGGRALEMLNPALIVSFIARLGGDYALAVAAIVALGVLWIGLSVAGGLASQLPVPVVSRVLAHAIPLLATTAMSRVLGVLLYVRGDTLDYGTDRDYLEPAWPGAVPRGHEPVLATTVAEPAGAAPEEPPAAEAPIAAAASPAEAPDRTPAASPEPPDPAGAIVAAVAAGDPAGAAELFAAYRGPPGAIPPRALFAIAKAASEQGRHPLSARALHAAGTGDDAAVAPNALLVLARVYERRLVRAAEARQVLEYLVGRWPNSEAAAHARAMLSPPAAG